MIGRFSNVGVYKDLFSLREFTLCLGGGFLALGGYLWGNAEMLPAWIGMGMALVSVAVNGLPIIQGAVRGLLESRVNVDELVSLAIAASLIQGEFVTAAVVSFIMTLGALIEEAVSESARRSIQALATITPDKATLLTHEGESVVPVSEVRENDRLLVKPGERIPVDGVIVSGVAAVDESSVTGESIPRSRKEGDRVLAGTLDYNGVIEISATRVGDDTTLGKVVQLVTEDESQ